MKRSTWIAVLGTAVVLVAAGNAPRLALPGVPAPVLQLPRIDGAAWVHAHVPSFTPRGAVRVPAAAASAGRPAVVRPTLLVTPRKALRGGLLALPLEFLLPVGAGLLAGAIAALAMVLRRDRRERVVTMARRGHAPDRIARRTHVPHDAVRTLIASGR